MHTCIDQSSGNYRWKEPRRSRRLPAQSTYDRAASASVQLVMLEGKDEIRSSESSQRYLQYVDPINYVLCLFVDLVCTLQLC